MKASKILACGVPAGAPLTAAMHCLARAAAGGVKRDRVRSALLRVVDDPAAWAGDAVWGELATALLAPRKAPTGFVRRAEPAPYTRWGEDLDATAVAQMEHACELPVAVAGALMPDAHVGYGLPIGGVLATEGAVIPYAVGMDIACRMKLSVYDLPPAQLEQRGQRLTEVLNRETRFGLGASFRTRREHAVMDEDWATSPVTGRLKDKAWSQLGTSGSGNHFVELGLLSLEEPELGLAPGTYLALLSHSGSRGVGGAVAQHYSRLAKDLHPELPPQLQRLAWLSLGREVGQEYWRAMTLMGAYAAANHALIHRHVAAALGATVVLDVENHHNFAWREVHDGREVIVHRKGATPAGEGVLGIIPGSMGAPGYVVRGRGVAASLDSASHGAGRRMSRTEAKKRFTWDDARRVLDARGVTLISAGLDEVPMAYKDIDQVMAAQRDLVEAIAKFEPKLVKMAPAGERPED